MTWTYDQMDQSMCENQTSE